MADDPTQNSRNPANSGHLAGALAEIMGKFLAGVDDMLPAVVIAYDRETNRATVRPLIQILKTDGTLVDRAEVASVPVFSIGGGNAVLSFNIIPGDLGWLKASDRDISLFLQNEAAEDVAPNTLRMHNFSDSLFFPDQFRKYVIADPIDDDAVVLQTLDGTKRIAIDNGGVRITSDGTIILDADTLVFLGDIFHAGDLVTFGTIIGTTDVSSGSISLRTHRHTGVTTGGGTTGGPV